MENIDIFNKIQPIASVPNCQADRQITVPNVNQQDLSKSVVSYGYYTSLESNKKNALPMTYTKNLVPAHIISSTASGINLTNNVSWQQNIKPSLNLTSEWADIGSNVFQTSTPYEKRTLEHTFLNKEMDLKISDGIGGQVRPLKCGPTNSQLVNVAHKQKPASHTITSLENREEQRSKFLTTIRHELPSTTFKNENYYISDATPMTTVQKISYNPRNFQNTNVQYVDKSKEINNYQSTTTASNSFIPTQIQELLSDSTENIWQSKVPLQQTYSQVAVPEQSLNIKYHSEMKPLWGIERNQNINIALPQYPEPKESLDFKLLQPANPITSSTIQKSPFIKSAEETRKEIEDILNAMNSYERKDYNVYLGKSSNAEIMVQQNTKNDNISQMKQMTTPPTKLNENALYQRSLNSQSVVQQNAKNDNLVLFRQMSSPLKPNEKNLLLKTNSMPKYTIQASTRNVNVSHMKAMSKTTTFKEENPYPLTSLQQPQANKNTAQLKLKETPTIKGNEENNLIKLNSNLQNKSQLISKEENSPNLQMTKPLTNQINEASKIYEMNLHSGVLQQPKKDENFLQPKQHIPDDMKSNEGCKSLESNFSHSNEFFNVENNLDNLNSSADIDNGLQNQFDDIDGYVDQRKKIAESNFKEFQQCYSNFLKKSTETDSFLEEPKHTDNNEVEAKKIEKYTQKKDQNNIQLPSSIQNPAISIKEEDKKDDKDEFLQDENKLIFETNDLKKTIEKKELNTDQNEGQNERKIPTSEISSISEKAESSVGNNTTTNKLMFNSFARNQIKENLKRKKERKLQMQQELLKQESKPEGQASNLFGENFFGNKGNDSLANTIRQLQEDIQNTNNGQFEKFLLGMKTEKEKYNLKRLSPHDKDGQKKPFGRRSALFKGHEIMVFRPTWEEFKDFKKYIKYIESEGANNAGIAKIIPPKEWIPRRSGYNIDDFVDINIEEPLRQTVVDVEKASAGSYIQKCSIMEQMTLKEFYDLNHTDAYKTPPHSSFKELEKYYWDHITEISPIYAADIVGSITDEDQGSWNISKLNTILDLVCEDYNLSYQGVNTPYLYFGMWKTTFPWHTEDMDLYSINYLHFGASKHWYAVDPKNGKLLESLAKEQYPEMFKLCPAFLRHKMSVMSPTLLEEWGIPFERMTQNAGEIIITFPYGYHSGFNEGFNCAESTNFATKRWIEYGKRCLRCKCTKNVTFPMSTFIKKFQPDKYDKWLIGMDFGPHPEEEFPEDSSTHRAASPPTPDEYYYLTKKNSSERLSESQINYRKRKSRCKICQACRRPDCLKCVFCQDRVKYGGPGNLKKACKYRMCEMNMSETEIPFSENLMNSFEVKTLESKSLVDVDSRQFKTPIKLKINISEKKTEISHSSRSDNSSNTDDATKIASEISDKPPHKKKKFKRCKTCGPCLREDCGDCKACRSKLKFGNQGFLKNACIKKRCENKIYI